MASFWSRCHTAFAGVLLLSLGYALGTFELARQEARAPAPLNVLQEDIHRGVPMVHVREINAGEIVGTVGSGARLVIGDTLIVSSLDGSFRTPAAPFLTNIIDVPVPHGASFVASSRGKNYYPVSSSAGEKLVPSNRIYFRTAEEAEAMGYKRGY